MDKRGVDNVLKFIEDNTYLKIKGLNTIAFVVISEDESVLSLSEIIGVKNNEQGVTLSPDEALELARQIELAVHEEQS